MLSTSAASDWIVPSIVLGLRIDLGGAGDPTAGRADRGPGCATEVFCFPDVDRWPGVALALNSRDWAHAVEIACAPAWLAGRPLGAE